MACSSAPWTKADEHTIVEGCSGIGPPSATEVSRLLSTGLPRLPTFCAPLAFSACSAIGSTTTPMERISSALPAASSSSCCCWNFWSSCSGSWIERTPTPIEPPVVVVSRICGFCVHVSAKLGQPPAVLEATAQLPVAEATR